jgi:hypothetical protein
MIWRCGPLLKKQVFLPEIRESRKERNTASPGRESGSSFQNDKIGKGGLRPPFFLHTKGFFWQADVRSTFRGETG